MSVNEPPNRGQPEAEFQLLPPILLENNFEIEFVERPLDEGMYQRFPNNISDLHIYEVMFQRPGDPTAENPANRDPISTNALYLSNLGYQRAENPRLSTVAIPIAVVRRIKHAMASWWDEFMEEREVRLTLPVAAGGPRGSLGMMNLRLGFGNPVSQREIADRNPDSSSGAVTFALYVYTREDRTVFELGVQLLQTFEP
ncbi:hypothetical protein NHQ30_006942 [Ciborinia camelliae]|nr:hypothetical protein NHQ30_006942 [Ciborinia camelliae]